MEKLGYSGNEVIYNVKRHPINKRTFRNIEAALRKNVTSITISKYVICSLFGWKQCVETVH